MGEPVFDIVETYFHQTRYVNYGIVRGLTRSGGIGEEAKKADGLAWILGSGGDACYLQDITPSYLWNDVYRTFRKRLRLACEFYDINIPWFLPTEIGGLGLPLPPGKVLSREDRAYAHCVLTKPKLFSKVKTLTSRLKGEWDTSAWVNKKFNFDRASSVVQWKTDYNDVLGTLGPLFITQRNSFWCAGTEQFDPCSNILYEYGRNELSLFRALDDCARLGRLYRKVKGSHAPQEIEFLSNCPSYMPLVSIAPQ